MPNELKISRNYHEALRRLGIKNPGEVNIGVPVQLTAQVDDVSHLAAPIVVPLAGVSDALGPTVGQREIIEVEARGSAGLWLLFAATSSSTDAVLYCAAATLITVPVVNLVPGFLSPADGSVPFQGQFRAGRTAAAHPDAPVLDVTGAISVPLFIPPGHFCGLMSEAANVFGLFSMIVQEIPLRAPGAAE